MQTSRLPLYLMFIYYHVSDSLKVSLKSFQFDGSSACIAYASSNAVFQGLTFEYIVASSEYLVGPLRKTTNNAAGSISFEENTSNIPVIKKNNAIADWTNPMEIAGAKEIHILLLVTVNCQIGQNPIYVPPFSLYARAASKGKGDTSTKYLNSDARLQYTIEYTGRETSDGTAVSEGSISTPHFIPMIIFIAISVILLIALLVTIISYRKKLLSKSAYNQSTQPYVPKPSPRATNKGFLSSSHRNSEGSMTDTYAIPNKRQSPNDQTEPGYDELQPLALRVAKITPVHQNTDSGEYDSPSREPIKARQEISRASIEV